MAFTPGDFNGDGRSDYVDYNIYTTQVDPYSGEYQGPSTSSGGGGGSAILALGFVGFLVLCFFAAMGDSVIVFRQFLYSGALLLLFPWKKFDRASYPLRKPYSIVVSILSFLVPAAIATLIISVSKSSFVVGVYGKPYDQEMEAFLIYYWPAIAYIILIFVAGKDIPGFIVACLLTALSPVLNQAVEAAKIMINRMHFFPQLLYFCLPCFALIFLMFAIVKPKNKVFSVLSLVAAVAYVLIINVQSRGFALVPELVMICVLSIMILIKQIKEKKTDKA